MNTSLSTAGSALARSLAAIVACSLVLSMVIPASAVEASPAQAQAEVPDDRIPMAPAAVEGTIIRLYQAAFGRVPDDAGLNHWVWRYTQGETLAEIAFLFSTSPEFTGIYGQADDANFVDRLYLNVLNRAGDPVGITDWNQALANGAPRWQVLVGFTESAENLTRTRTPASAIPRTPLGSPVQEAAIVRLYQAAFLRAPDNGGLDQWVATLRRGASLTSIAESFIASEEFFNRYGVLDDAGFVDRLYGNVLGRQADVSGRAFWIGIAQTSGRAAVLHGLAQSAEFSARTRTPAWAADQQAGVPNNVLLIGDSILEGLRLSSVAFGAQSTTFDTAVSRQMSHLPGRLALARAAGPLPEAVVIHLGTNSWTNSYNNSMLAQLETLANRRVVLVDVAVVRSWTEQANIDIHAAAELYPNVILVEWSEALSNRSWLRSDRVHPSAEGRIVLTDLIAAALVSPL